MSIHQNNTDQRKRWLSVLSKSSDDAVIALWEAQGLSPAYDMLRPAESGLVMTRARMGGTGDSFNLGEITVTRCSVYLSDGVIGHSYIAGRNKKKAEVVAVIDALMQGESHDVLETAIIAPLEAQLNDARETEARKAAATKVDFFTLARSTTPS